MKRILICFCLIATPLLSFGQHQTSFGFSGSINFSSSASRSANSTVRSQGDPTWANIRGKLNYRIAGNFNFRIFDQVMMKTGLGLVQVGYKKAYEIGRYNKIEGHKSFDHRYMEFPLSFQYQFTASKLNFYMDFGASALFYINTKTTFQHAYKGSR